MLNRIPRWVIIGTVVLAFSAGYVNCVALLGFVNYSVSHVTGSVSLLAEAIASAQLQRIYQIGLIILFFFLGAVLSGFLIRHESLKMGRRYGLALAIEAGLLFLATFLFYQRMFYGELAASMACGLQNALVATYSGSAIRTTHLTGIVSDLGAEIGYALRGSRFNKKQFQLQLAIFLSFLGGGIIGAIAFVQVEYLAFLVPACIVLIASLIYHLMQTRHIKVI
ncbi:MAG: YoaK family protein [Pseudomonadota bacterium]|nr:YoaK family protein [Pseudomonadota bacterium]